MTKRMLIEATHPEETRVVVVDGKRLDEFDYESANKRQLKGNIYLAKVTRVEPSLQAAFVDYGGNRHGFLAFSEIHPDYYRIPVADREALLAEHAAMAAEDAASDAEEDLAVNNRADLAAGSIEAARPTEDSAEPAGADDDEASAADDEFGDAVPLRMTSEKRFGPEVEKDDAIETGAAAVETSADVEASEAISEPTASARSDGESPPPAGGAAPAASPAALETVGGDEAEEVRRRRSRPLRRYKIQEVIKRRQIMLVQVTKEERGNKGAALTTYLSLAGRYCVLMPNTGRGGGISRKITSATDRKRLKSVLEDFDIPDGMAVIVRTAGSERNKTELRRDYEYLVRLWDEIRELTLQSTAPTLIYEEASLIKRAIRDLYSRDIEEVLVEGEDGYKAAKNFMRTLMPSHAKRVQLYSDEASHLFHRFQVESQLDAIHNPVVGLRSGGYIVINSTEALVAIDVNSGRATRERNIEETALRTNLEAADEIARQLRLRDLAGLIVIDFIDMEENRNNAAVERRLKEAMRHDRARIQVGRISPFGLLELSRQRLRPSLIEASTEICRYCRGSGHVRSTESTALHVLRGIEEEGIRSRSAALNIAVPNAVALYILNHKRAALAELEQRHGLRLTIGGDDSLIPPDYRMERLKAQVVAAEARQPVSQPDTVVEDEETTEEEDKAPAPETQVQEPSGGHRRSRRRRRRREEGQPPPPQRAALSEPASDAPGTRGGYEDERTDVDEAGAADKVGAVARSASESQDQDGEGNRRRRRRGRRGGRRRRRGDRSGPSLGSDVSEVRAAPMDSEHLTGDPVADRADANDAAVSATFAPTGESAEPVEFRPGDDREFRSTDRPDEPTLEPGTNERHGFDAQAHPAADESRALAAVVPAADDEINGHGPSPAAAEVEVEPEPAPQQPAGSARRGWWKRLIE